MHYAMYWSEEYGDTAVNSIDLETNAQGAGRIIEWPRGTWFQQRRALLLQQEAEDLLS